MPCSCSCADPQLWVEQALAVERGHLVRSADMLAVDENLRHAGAPAGTPDHLVAPPRLLVEVDLGVADALLLQECTGARAIGAPHRRIHLDLGHQRRAPK